jgi:hypothetical protein
MDRLPRPDRSNLRNLFAEALRESLARLGGPVTEDVEDYVLALLLDSVRSDSRIALTSPDGQRLGSVVELLAWCEVGLKAGSFAEERAARVRIGDYVLFWSGANPGILGPEPYVYQRIAKESYRVAGTFDFHPFADSAPTLARLSRRFEDVAESLRIVYASLRTFEA